MENPSGVGERLQRGFESPGSDELRAIGPGDRLRQAWTERGYASAEAFATAVGVRPGTLRQQLARPSLPRDAAIRYAAFLNKSLTWLLTGRPGNDVPPTTMPVLDPFAGSGSFLAHTPRADMRNATLSAPHIAPARPESGQIAEDLVGARDLPVYGAAQGGDGGITVDPHPIEWVKRPSPLLSVAKGFAVYVIGDSMAPVYEQGDMVLVHPGLPVTKGDDALLVNIPEGEAGDWHAIVKRVAGWNEQHWKLRQYNPAKDFEVSRAKFPRAFRIVGKYNRR